MTEFRWRLADEEADSPQGSLFDGDREGSGIERHVGTGEFRGMEFLHVNARRIINEVPAASRMPFRFTINAYRGCSHACAYCLSGDTPILMGDGRPKRLADVRVGDAVYGTIRDGSYRRYVKTEVLAHWSSCKAAFRVTLADGTELIASGDHRFLTGRGWKHVTGSGSRPQQRPHLTLNDSMLGVGHFAAPPEHDEDYRRGYLCGLIRGDGTLGSYSYIRPDRGPSEVHRFRLALVDAEPLERAASWLSRENVATRSRVFQAATPTRKALTAIGSSSRSSVDTVRSLVEWPDAPTVQWRKGFLAGIFDAEGSYSRGILRICNTDRRILDTITESLDVFGFDYVVEDRHLANGLRVVRIRKGIREHLRFFHLTDPVTTRKRSIEGVAIKSDAALEVVGIEPLGVELPMYDITTGTGDFIANGVVSHNCFARPTHEYLGLNIGRDFEEKIVVKVNAVERLQAELSSRTWRGDHIAMGTNTDPYQRCEGKYHLTQGIIRVLAEHRNPFSILTKSTLILRDLDALAAAAQRAEVRANFSIGTLDERVWKLTEPGTPHPRRRVEAVRKLNEAGVPCGVLVAPIIPGMSDSDDQLREVIGAVVEAGAATVSAIGLHLRPGVRDHWLDWLRAEDPQLAAEHEATYTRSYLPKRKQDDLSERVKSILGKARAQHVRSGRSRSNQVPADYLPPAVAEPVAPPVPAPRPPAEAAEQLGLAL